jgi:hypothetical protein
MVSSFVSATARSHSEHGIHLSFSNSQTPGFFALPLNSGSHNEIGFKNAINRDIFSLT